MGITVTSSASITPTASATAAASTASGPFPDSGAATGFAALLAELGAGLQLSPTTTEVQSSAKTPLDEEALAETEAGNPLLNNDPANALQSMLPFLPPPTSPGTPATAEPKIIALTTDETATGSGKTDLPGIPLLETGRAAPNPLGGTAMDVANTDKRLLNEQLQDKQQATLNAPARPESSLAAPGKLETLLKTTETANIAVETGPNTPGNASFASALNALTATRTAEENKTSAQAHIPIAVGAPGWGQALGDKVIWAARNDVQTAQISINPPQLGPMQISLSLSGDQATAVFASAHGEVRQAIEAAMPQLREMLSASGITLGDASVGAQLPQQQQRDPQYQFANGNRSTGENAILPADGSHETIVTAAPLQRGRGLVDLFA